jgi:cation diffusion facilitator family transporter
MCRAGHNADVIAGDRDARLASRIALSGIAASALLAVLNTAGGLLSGSTAVLATGVEFAGDVFASSVVLFGTIAAARPADANHPYGHGRAETLAAIVVGLGLVAGGAGISWRSLRGVGDLHAPPTSLATIVIGISILIRGGMAILKFRIGRRVGSSALVADAWNDTVDILAGVAALTAVGLAMYDPRRFLTADHYGAFAVGLLVILTGVRVFRDASLDLMDTMPGQDRIDTIRNVALVVAGVRGVEKVHARKTGFRYHVDLHVEVDAWLTVADAHAIGGEVRSRLRTDLPWVADVLVHVEPAQA